MSKRTREILKKNLYDLDKISDKMVNEMKAKNTTMEHNLKDGDSCRRSVQGGSKILSTEKKSDGFSFY